MEYNNEMVSIKEAAKRLGMRQETLRNQIVRKKTPFSTWCVKTASGGRRFFIPRKSFEAWLCFDEAENETKKRQSLS